MPTYPPLSHPFDFVLMAAVLLLAVALFAVTLRWLRTRQQRERAALEAQAATQREEAAEALRRVTERYRTIVEQSPDAIWLAENGRLRLVNRACVELLGAGDEAALVGQAIEILLPELPELHASAAAGRGVLRGELRARRLDGREIEVELTLADVPDHDGRAVQGVMREIGERKRAEAALRDSQAALEQAQRLARLGYATLDVARGEWILAPSMAELLGRPPGSTIVHAEDWSVVHPDDRARLRHHLDTEVLQGRAPYELEFRIVRADDGRQRWLRAIGSTQRDAAGRISHLFVTVQDITDSQTARLALEQSREELRRLSDRLIQAREDERRHLARELHDELGQRLSVLKLDLATLRTLAADPAHTPAQLEPSLTGLFTAVDEALAATRRLAADLRPAMLDDLGLQAALGWLAADWRRRTGMRIELDGELHDADLSEAAVTTVYRIVQEALTNVLRHAGASRVRITLARDESDLVVAVEDNGRGLAPGDMAKRDSAGLAGIRERARNLGGVATAANRPEGGCRVEARLPLQRIDSQHGRLQDGIRETPQRKAQEDD